MRGDNRYILPCRLSSPPSSPRPFHPAGLLFSCCNNVHPASSPSVSSLATGNDADPLGLVDKPVSAPVRGISDKRRG